MRKLGKTKDEKNLRQERMRGKEGKLLHLEQTANQSHGKVSDHMHRSSGREKQRVGEERTSFFLRRSCGISAATGN